MFGINPIFKIIDLNKFKCDEEYITKIIDVDAYDSSVATSSSGGGNTYKYKSQKYKSQKYKSQKYRQKCSEILKK